MAPTDLDLPPHGHLASINDIEMYYEIHGQGPPLLLLHGFFSSASKWEIYLPHLTEHYQVIAVDLRGHGRSTNPSGVFTHRQAALDCLALMDMLEIETVRGMGHSTGAMTLIQMATLQPGRVEAMALLSGTIYYPVACREINRQYSPANLSDEQWEQARQTHKHGDDQIRMLATHFHDFADSYEDMSFTPPQLATITARTLIVHGDRDHFFPVSIPIEMYQSIPRSYLWVVPNWGHGSPDVHSDKFMALFIETLLAFLPGDGDWDAPA